MGRSDPENRKTNGETGSGEQKYRVRLNPAYSCSMGFGVQIYMQKIMMRENVNEVGF